MGVEELLYGDGAEGVFGEFFAGALVLRAGLGEEAAAACAALGAVGGGGVAVVWGGVSNGGFVLGGVTYRPSNCSKFWNEIVL